MWTVEEALLLLPGDFDVLEGIDNLTLRCRVCGGEMHFTKHANRTYVEGSAIAHRIACKALETVNA